MGHFREFQRQLVAKVESTKGTAETLTDSTDGKVRVVNLRVNPTPERFAVPHHREAFEMPPDVVGGASMELSFGIRLVGHSSGVGTEPEWSKYFKACGYSVTAFTKLDLTGAITSGPFFHGETVTEVRRARRGRSSSTRTTARR